MRQRCAAPCEDSCRRGKLDAPVGSRALKRFVAEQYGVESILSLFGNPVDMVRVATLIVLNNITIFGAAGAAMLRFLGGRVLSLFLLVAGLLVWVSVPLVIADRMMRRQDI